MTDESWAFDLPGHPTVFLWGPRQKGMSTLLHARFPKAPHYHLLLAPKRRRLLREPGILRQEVEAMRRDRGPAKEPVVIDEILRLPELLDLVHWLIVHRKVRFVLSGSSARTLRRGGGNLLDGRAARLEFFSLTSAEISDVSLERTLNHGCLPSHYLSDDPEARFDPEPAAVRRAAPRRAAPRRSSLSSPRSRPRRAMPSRGAARPGPSSCGPGTRTPSSSMRRPAARCCSRGGRSAWFRRKPPRDSSTRSTERRPSKESSALPEPFGLDGGGLGTPRSGPDAAPVRVAALG